MTSRTQITLDSETQRRVRERASGLGVSFAEYIRRLVVRDLGAPGPAAKPQSVFNLGSSGGSDVSRNKDAMLAAAFAQKTRRRKRV